MNYKKNLHFIILIGIFTVSVLYILLGFSRETMLIDRDNHYEEYQIAQVFALEESRINKINTNLRQTLLSDSRFLQLLKQHRFKDLETSVGTIFKNLMLSEEKLHFLNLYLYKKNTLIRLGSDTCKNTATDTAESADVDHAHSGFAIIHGELTYVSRLPITLDGKVRGMLETGVSARSFLTRFSNVLGGYSAVALRTPLPSPLAKTDRAFPGFVVALSDFKAFSHLPASFNPDLDNQEVALEEHLFHLHTDQVIIGIDGRKLGHFLLLIDHTASRNALITYALTALVVTVILVIVIFYFSNILLARITRRIEKSKNDITRLNTALAQKAELKTKELDTHLSLLNSYKQAVDKSNIVSKTDPDGFITYVNDEFLRVSGYTKEELIGRPHNVIRHPDMPTSVFEELWRTITAKKIWKGIVKNRKKDGTPYLVDSTIVPVLNTAGEIVEFIAIRHDITDLVRQKQELQEIKTDRLTGLGNKNVLKEELESVEKNLLAILNIDNYREIKDFYGVEVTDGIIKQLAASLRNHTTLKHFLLFRITSEQFALLYKNPLDVKPLMQEITRLIHEITQNPIVYDGYEIYVDLTAGVACEPDGETIFRDADLALKEARRQNIDIYLYHEAIGILKEYEKNIFWTSQLKKAIATDRLAAYFQPIVDNETGRYAKYEALIRMRNEDGSVTSPYFFLDMAKRSRLYPSITRTIIRQCVEAFRENDREFSINLTADDIHNAKTVAFLEESLMENTLADRCVLEITESEEIKDYKRVVEFIKHFKSLGCKIAIDDFGSGYSNFNYIADLGADYIKIDGSLIKNIDTDPTSERIVRTIISFAKSMEMKTVAEFVATESIYQKVKALGVDYSQGFYFAEPRETVVTEKTEE